jgi:primosomal protein N' (replication factor Y)
VQTHYPDHPALLAMAHSSYKEQARILLQQRQQSGLPPAGQMIILRTDCANADYAEEFLQQLRTRSAPNLPGTARLIGPLPSPMQRRAGKYRAQLIVTATDRATAQRAARLLVACAEAMPVRQGLKWSIDIDPQDIF